MKYVFIVNPHAGMQDELTNLVPKIEQKMKERGVEYEIIPTEYANHAREIARAVAERGEEVRVVSCGGDGTLNECAGGLVGFENAALAAYPCGGGNDFIKTVGEREDFDFDAIIDGESVKIDTLSVNGVCCLNLASVGIDADVNAARQKYCNVRFLRGALAYDLALVECLLKPIGKDMEIEIDGEKMSGKFLLAAAGNGRVYGGGYHAAPEAYLDDGLMDIITVDKIPLLKIAGVLAKYKKGKHIVNGEVMDSLKGILRYKRGSSLVVKSEKEFVLNNDGETDDIKVMEVHIVPKSLNLVIPPRSDRRGLLNR